MTELERMKKRTVEKYKKVYDEVEKLSNKTLTSIDDIITHQSDNTKKQ